MVAVNLIQHNFEKNFYMESPLSLPPWPTSVSKSIAKPEIKIHVRDILKPIPTSVSPQYQLEWWSSNSKIGDCCLVELPERCDQAWWCRREDKEGVDGRHWLDCGVTREKGRIERERREETLGALCHLMGLFSR